MATMPFPDGYEDDLWEEKDMEKKKRLTLRIDSQYGIYHPGEIYDAITYKGVPIGLTIKVTEVIHTVVGPPGIRLDGDRKGIRSILHIGPMDRVWFKVIKRADHRTIQLNG